MISVLLWLFWVCLRVVAKLLTYTKMLRFGYQSLSFRWWLDVWLLVFGQLFASIRMWSSWAITWIAYSASKGIWGRISFVRAYRAIKVGGNWRRSTKVEVDIRVINFVVYINITVLSQLQLVLYDKNVGESEPFRLVTTLARGGWNLTSLFQLRS